MLVSALCVILKVKLQLAVFKILHINPTEGLNVNLLLIFKRFLTSACGG
jgi:hypothetical protein